MSDPKFEFGLGKQTGRKFRSFHLEMDSDGDILVVATDVDGRDETLCHFDHRNGMLRLWVLPTDTVFPTDNDNRIAVGIA